MFRLRLPNICDYDLYRALYYELRGEQDSIDWFEQSQGALEAAMWPWKFIDLVIAKEGLCLIIQWRDSLNGELTDVGYLHLTATELGVLCSSVYIKREYIREERLTIDLRIGLKLMLGEDPIAILFECNLPGVVISPKFNYQKLKKDQNNTKFNRLRSSQLLKLLKGDCISDIEELRQRFLEGEDFGKDSEFANRYFIIGPLRALHGVKGDPQQDHKFQEALEFLEQIRKRAESQ